MGCFWKGLNVITNGGKQEFRADSENPTLLCFQRFIWVLFKIGTVTTALCNDNTRSGSQILCLENSLIEI